MRSLFSCAASASPTNGGEIASVLGYFLVCLKIAFSAECMARHAADDMSFVLTDGVGRNRSLHRWLVCL